MSLLLGGLLLGIGLKINEFGDGRGSNVAPPAGSALQFDYSTTATSQALFL